MRLNSRNRIWSRWPVGKGRSGDTTSERNSAWLRPKSQASSAIHSIYSQNIWSKKAGKDLRAHRRWKTGWGGIRANRTYLKLIIGRISTPRTLSMTGGSSTRPSCPSRSSRFIIWTVKIPIRTQTNRACPTSSITKTPPCAEVTRKFPSTRYKMK